MLVSSQNHPLTSYPLSVEELFSMGPVPGDERLGTAAVRSPRQAGLDLCTPHTDQPLDAGYPWRGEHALRQSGSLLLRVIPGEDLNYEQAVATSLLREVLSLSHPLHHPVQLHLKVHLTHQLVLSRAPGFHFQGVRI